MNLFQEYELVRLVHDGATKTFRANDTATGRAVFVHLLNGSEQSAETQLRRLSEEVLTMPSDETPVLRVGESDGAAFVVTDVIEGFAGFDAWCEERPQPMLPDPAGWLSRIEQSIERKNYAWALELCKKAQAAHPGHHDIDGMTAAVGMAARAWSLSHKGNERCLHELSRALESAPSSEAIRRLLVETKLDWFHRLRDTEGAKAEQLLRDVLELDPGNAGAQKGLNELAGTSSPHSASSAQEGGPPPTHHEFIADPRVFSVGMDPPEFPPRDLRVETRVDEPVVSNPIGDVQTVGREDPPTASPKHSESVPTVSVARDLAVLSQAAALEAPGSNRDWHDPPHVPLGRKGHGPSAPDEPVGQPQPRPASKQSITPVLPIRWNEVVKSVKRWPLLTALLGGILAAFAIAAVTRLDPPKSPPPVPAAVTQFPVQINSVPVGGIITVDGERCGESSCQLDLEPGTYVLAASLAGHRGLTRDLVVDAEGRVSQEAVILHLEPITPSLHVSSNLEQGTVLLDGVPLGELTDGAFEFLLNPRGDEDHVLEVTSKERRVSARFGFSGDGMPRLRGPMEAQQLRAAGLTARGSHAVVYSSSLIRSVRLNGDDLGEVNDTELELNGLELQSHELILTTADGTQTLIFDARTDPSLGLYLLSNPNVGGLRVVADQDGAIIRINGRRQRRVINRGKAVVWLPPGEYDVELEKDGYEPTGPRKVVIRQGDMALLNFGLIPLNEQASLRIQNGVPGSEVKIDGLPVGRVDTSGTFLLPDLSPGRHEVTLEEASHRSKTVHLEFPGSAVVDLDGALQNAMGQLDIRVLPQDAEPTLLLVSESGSRREKVTGSTLTVREGTYSVRASAPGFEDYVATVRVVAGETKTALVNLPRESGRQHSAMTLADWEAAGGWQRDGNTLSRRGGGVILAPMDPSPGTYQLTAHLLRGRRLEWVVRYHDAANYVLYQLGKNALRRTVVAEGKKSETREIDSPIGLEGFVSVRVEAMSSSVTISLLKGQDWKTVDEWNGTDGQTGLGSFGLRVRGRDQISLTHFSFYPAR